MLRPAVVLPRRKETWALLAFSSFLAFAVVSITSNQGPPQRVASSSLLGKADTNCVLPKEATPKFPAVHSRNEPFAQQRKRSAVLNLSGGYYGTGDAAKVAHPAPPFAGAAVMPDGTFKHLSLDSFKGKWLVLLFYPLDFTFVCPTELTAFSDKVPEFSRLNAQVIGISIDSKYTHLQWTKTPRKEGGVGALQYPLLSDLNRSIGESYGCMHPDGHHVRGTYIIDPKGVVRHITLNDPPVGRNADEIIRLIEGYQYADQHGEVCPHGWTPGQATIKPTPEQKGQYFARAY
eukprot:CAMPEP_0114492642 /NCGR_PEP_ID=MMETSP0109-20121206/3670_1 /TAXON_ID=29199 /ORGANISM="Chlorarachnion reptans, Strain CCCM449" /LENGTH=289 /DNA_ID=CAMNT_0001669511 /DNA_START=289 /DNA_END=1158 /DNA_ORIENTATION=+